MYECKQGVVACVSIQEDGQIQSSVKIMKLKIPKHVIISSQALIFCYENYENVHLSIQNLECYIYSFEYDFSACNSHDEPPDLFEPKRNRTEKFVHTRSEVRLRCIAFFGLSPNGSSGALVWQIIYPNHHFIEVPSNVSERIHVKESTV